MTKTVLKAVATEKISLSNYKIIELIGTGGMANIYKAIQLSLDRPVALKIMHQHLSLDEGFVARFEKEAKQAAQLHHENIVSIIDYGHENSDYYIAMEYVEGKNLKEIMEVQSRLPLEICLLVCHQVAEGLKYAHSHNIVHRDIKPANIILSFDGRVMITDFGIAKGGDDLTITATGQMIGSPAYMSPEQAAGQQTDHRTDLFSLGIILYEIIAGEKPFKGETYQAMVASIMAQRPASLQQLRVDVNTELEKLVEKAVVKDAESRFQSAEELSDAIYAQLERFKLPPIKKLISNFLLDPYKITEKLRSEKISNHMESALYYLTLGEGRLNDARREFKEVLRFDRNNKSAKAYLSKLEERSSMQVSAPPVQASKKQLKLWHSIASAAFIFATITSLAVFLPRNEPGKSPRASNRQSATEDPSLKASQEKSREPQPDQGKKTSVGGAADDNSSRKPGGTGSKKGSPNASKEKGKTLATSDGKSYNYPDQKIKEFGFLMVKTNVPADVYVDLTRYGKSNGPAMKLSPGRHFVEVRADGYRRMTRRLFTEKDKTSTLQVDLIADR